MSPLVHRGLLLYQQDRYELAEKQLRGALAQDPEDAFAKALLARTVSELDRHDEALELAGEAIAQAPDGGFCHATLALVLRNLDRRKDALLAIEEAIRLDPEDANYRGTQAAILISLEKWEQALLAAENGLALDAEHGVCTNLCSMALQFLGRTEEAAATASAAMGKNPDDAMAHANLGWASLRAGDPRQAEEHFRESLRLQPGNEWARDGVIRAIKARNPLYRGLLKFWLWMSTLKDGAQWAVFLGLIFGRRILAAIADASPTLEPFARALGFLLLAFVLLTWVGDPLFNLTLRLHPLGRHALTPDERRASTFFGLLILGAIVSAIVGMLGAGPMGFGIAVGLVAFTLPLSATYASEGRRRRKLATMTTLLGAVGVAAAISAFLESSSEGLFIVVYMLGVVGFTWYAALTRDRGE